MCYHSQVSSQSLAASSSPPLYFYYLSIRSAMKAKVSSRHRRSDTVFLGSHGERWPVHQKNAAQQAGEQNIPHLIGSLDDTHSIATRSEASRSVLRHKRMNSTGSFCTVQSNFTDSSPTLPNLSSLVMSVTELDSDIRHYNRNHHRQQQLRHSSSLQGIQICRSPAFDSQHALPVTMHKPQQRTNKENVSNKSFVTPKRRHRSVMEMIGPRSMRAVTPSVPPRRMMAKRRSHRRDSCASLPKLKDIGITPNDLVESMVDDDTPSRGHLASCKRYVYKVPSLFG